MKLFVSLSRRSMAFLTLLLLLSLKSNAQSSDWRLITWPTEGAVFQEHASTQLYVTGQIPIQNYTSSIFKVRLEKKNSSGNWEQKSFTTLTSASHFKDFPNTGITGYFLSLNPGSNPKGWYRISLGFQFGIFPFIVLDTREVGIGDVYFIAGQSNAAGAYWQSVGDDHVPFFSSQVNNKMARYIRGNDEQGNYNLLVSGNTLQKVKTVPIGNLTSFSELTAGIDNSTVNNRNGIYPSGETSWYWSDFANKIANTGTPVLLFNTAISNSPLGPTPYSHQESWNYNNYGTSHLLKRFESTLDNFGQIFGARAVLWHQGERDVWEVNSTDYFTQYQNSLTRLIDSSRAKLGSELNWYVSEVSHFRATADSPSQFGRTVTTWQPGCAATDFPKKMVSSDLRSKQANVLNARPNVYAGINSDDSFNECARGDRQKVHFTGSNLGNISDAWIDSLNSQSPSVPPTQTIPLETVSLSGTTYTLKAPAFPSAEYFWVLNSGTISSSPESRTKNIQLGADDFIVCYIKKTDGRLYMTQPFTRVPPKLLSPSSSSVNFSSNQNQTLSVDSKGLIWYVDSKPDWVSFTSNSQQNLNLTASTNNTGSSRSGSVILKELEGTTTKTISVNQNSNSSGADLSLTSLTPTSASAGWGSPNYNGLNVGGNDIYISGIKYTQGIGTHAQSHINYNIPSGYQYFKGKVGRDDAADGCNCGDMLTSFTIKLNGATVWNSGQHGISTPAEDFNINLGGSGGTLELINNAGANNWGDWADWVNIYLSNTIGNNSIPEPTYYYSNPASISSGQSSTLNATCSTGLVTWSTGQTGSGVSVSPSVTTSYTVRCVSGSLQSDPRTVSVTVSGGGTCSVLSNNLVMGTWNITGDQLVTRNFHNDFWLVQKVNVNGSQYDEFVVRAGEMLQRSDVSLNNSSYSGLVNCYALEYSAYGGLLGPNHTSTVPFATPVGYTLYYAQDGTPYYSNYNTSSGAITNNGCYRIKSLANNYYLTAIGGDYNEFQSGNSGNNKIWKFSTTDNTNWKIKSGSGDNKYLYGEGTYCGARVKRTSNGSQANQLWRYDQNGNNFRFFLPNGTTWDHEGAGTLNNLQMCGDNTQGFQNWRLVSLEGVSCPSGVRVGNAEAGRIEEVELPLLTIAPNPTDGLIHVSLNASQAGPAVLNLLDITGKKYLEHSLKAKMGLNEFDIDATWASPGTYLLQATVGEKNGSVRVVIE
ncbi:MAG: NPCBM/NEW2 domain-containing protein [Cytophagales bacterium]|nr:NPCBM/NEW2 domain-containing protein [Cytophagales bacterium]